MDRGSRSSNNVGSIIRGSSLYKVFYWGCSRSLCWGTMDTNDMLYLVAADVDLQDAVCVELHKTSAGLGFSLDGGKASIYGDRPLFIKRIFKGMFYAAVTLHRFMLTG